MEKDNSLDEEVVLQVIREDIDISKYTKKANSNDDDENTAEENSIEDTSEEEISEDTLEEDVLEEEETDDEDDEDYEDEEEDEETLRRRERHSRRVRNQIISYSIISIILIAIGIGIYFLTSTTLGYIRQYRADIAAQEAAQEAEQATAEEVVIEAPSIVEAEAVAEEEIDTTIYEDIDYLGEAVDAMISQMTIEDKVSQLFMLTPEALTGVDAATQAGSGTKDALDKYAICGLVYNSKNILDAEQFAGMIENTVGMSKYELFLAVTEPGGDASIVANSSIADIPHVDSPAVIGEGNDSSMAYNAGLTISSYLSALGINMNLSPDGSVIKDEEAISADTSYGAEEAVVYDMAVKMIEGLKEGNVAACMTGFPGNGNITSKTAEGVVESDINSETIEAQLLPYISGIAAGAPAVMINNVTYTTVDTDACPASVSKYIIGQLLRGNMGFDGIVITAPMTDKAITENLSSAEAAVNALLAGADVIYMPESFEEAYAGVLEAIAAGTITEDRINESLNRIFRVKLADDITM